MFPPIIVPIKVIPGRYTWAEFLQTRWRGLAVHKHSLRKELPMAIPIVFCSLVFSECCTPRGWMYHPLSAPVCFFCNTSVRFYLLLKCTLLLYSNPHTLSELSVNIGTLLLNSLGILVNYKYVLTKLLHRFCGHRFCKSLHPLTKLVAQCG